MSVGGHGFTRKRTDFSACPLPAGTLRGSLTAWELLRVAPGAPLTRLAVEQALERIIRQEHPAYAQLWTSLTRVQKKVLKAVIVEAGQNLTSAEVLRAHGVAASTMHKTLGILDEKGILREDEVGAATRYRLEDPFLGAWLRHAQEM